MLAEYQDPRYGECGLVIVGSFAPDQLDGRKTAQAVFCRRGVPLYGFDDLEPLLAEIRQHGHS